MWESKFEELLRQFLPFLPQEEQLTTNANLREFGLDSLAMVELLATLESEYQVRFEDDALTLETFETPGTLWQTLSVLVPAS
jgi:acyl carrier protein